MSKSALLKSSIAKKYWMALTGLFLCTFLIGHLLGNLQLVLKTGEEGRRAFNEYAYFMGHNIFIKILAYVTYISIIFHAVDGLMLAFQNKAARPQGYAYNNQGANTPLPSRYMAILGTIVLVFIATHMANFWWKQKVTEDVPLHTKTIVQNGIEINYFLTTKGDYIPYSAKETKSGVYLNMSTGQPVMSAEDTSSYSIKEKTLLFEKNSGLQVAEGYKDLHTVVMTFFSKQNSLGVVYVAFYVLSMIVLGFHLWHGFASAFQSLGLNHKRYNGAIKFVGRAFAVLVSAAFAIIPIIIYVRS